MSDPFKVYETARSRIDGWLAMETVTSIVRLTIQHGTGDILEIGTYRGQSAAVLASLLRPNGRLFISDLFEPNHPRGDPANMMLNVCGSIREIYFSGERIEIKTPDKRIEPGK